MQKVLLIEPNYANKYPPMGLMKLATYYRNRGDWEVVFFKGDLKDFEIERITDKYIDKLNLTDDRDNINWKSYKNILFKYIKTKKKDLLDILPLPKEAQKSKILSDIIIDAKNYYHKGIWINEPEWDRVHITTLFTFYWDITIKTIEFAKKLAKDWHTIPSFMVGGVLATLQYDQILEETGVHCWKGLLNKPGDLDPDDTQIIDNLPLDYSILDEIEYKYPMANGYYGYTTKGCIRNCPFCAVKTLEPVFTSYIPLKPRIDQIRNLYGEQKDLLLMDNNVLASKDYPKIIEDIISCGFGKDAVYIEPNHFEMTLKNLKDNVNDRAYTKKLWKLILELESKVKGQDKKEVEEIIDEYKLRDFNTVTKHQLIEAGNKVSSIYEKFHKKKRGQKRYVDFNQGLDARLFTEEKAQLLAKIAIKPARIAFDNIKTEKEYTNAIEMCAKAGIKDFSNYILYNFTDEPDDLWKRLEINVKLSERLQQYNVHIYSFPMKYQPLWKKDDMEEDFSHNRGFLGKHWNRKYIRAIQCILNSTQGKVGGHSEFFYRSFGANIEEFHKLLMMPEPLIVYRLFFDWLGTAEAKKIAKKNYSKKYIYNSQICNYSTKAWFDKYNECKEMLDEEDLALLNKTILKSDFSTIPNFKNSIARDFLIKYYKLNINKVLESGTDLNIMKQAYDANPTMQTKFKRHNTNLDVNL